jgi:hypothetical protein
LEYLIAYRAEHAYVILMDLSKDESLSPWDKIERLIDFYVDKVLNNLRFHNIMYQQANSPRSEEIRDVIISIKMRNLEQMKKIIRDGQQKGLFRQIDIEMTIGTMMGTITSYSQSREWGCRILDIDYSDEEKFRTTLAPRLKAHLKQLFRAHLDIKNESK